VRKAVVAVAGERVVADKVNRDVRCYRSGSRGA
jgi:hypothetical protein